MTRPLDWSTAAGPHDCRVRARRCRFAGGLLTGEERARLQAHAERWDARADAWAAADAERRILAVRFLELAMTRPTEDAAEVWRAACAAQRRFLACAAGEELPAAVLDLVPDRKTAAAG